jgi:uncharacterized protein (TIGR02996 family)
VGDNWDDDTPRLVYADWLEEHGQPAKAEFLRLECRLARRSPTDKRVRRFRARFREIGRTLDREFLLSVSRVRQAWGVGEKLSEVVSRILAGFATNPPRDRCEREVSAWLRAIPLGVDGMSYIMLHPEGYISDVLLEGETEDQWLASQHGEPAVLGHYLRVRAKRRYPELWSEMERVGATLPRCPSCRGRGRNSHRSECEVCGGLGWVPDVDA